MSEGFSCTRRRALGMMALPAAAGFAGLPAAVIGATPETLQIRIINTAGTSNFVFQELLHDLGILKKLRLEVTTQNAADGNKVIDALLKDEADVCMQAGFGPVLIAIEKGAPLKMIAGGNALSPQAIYSAKPDIQQLKDLVGRTVGVGAMGAAMHQKIVALLRKRGIDDSKVKFVNVGSTLDSLKATRAGTIDAGIADIDIYTDQAKYGVHSLRDGDLWNELTEYPNQASFATERSIVKNREAIVRIVAAYAKLYRFLESPQSMRPWMTTWARVAKVPVPDQPDLLWRLYQEKKPFPPKIALTPAQIDFVQQTNVSMGLQKAMLPYDRVFDNSIAPAALKLVG